MELSRRDFRVMMYYDYLKGLHPEESFATLTRYFGKSAPCRATVFNWFREFRGSRPSLEDEHRSGRPATAVTPENVLATRKLIEEDPRITKAEIETTVGIGSAATNTILHDHLQVRKRCARCIYPIH